MLKSLYVKNFALIDEVHIQFDGGLNILTGETGAGKSILIGALGLILGERASSDSVRQGAEKAIVEGLFNVGDNEHIQRSLRESDYDVAEELIIRREVTAKGASRAFVNDSPAPLGFVKELGDHLVDLHGQHEHQMLLRQETHISFLDNAIGLEDQVKAFAPLHAELQATQRALAETREREAQLRQKQEFYEYQLREIDNVDPKPGEDQTIQQELKIMENGERIFALTTELNGILCEQQNSVRDQLYRARQILEQLAGIDGSFAEYEAECASAGVIIDEITKFVAHYAQGVEFSPAAIETMRERLMRLSGIRKKFGGTIDAVLAYREEIAGEIELARNFDARIEELERELEERRRVAGVRAAKLSQQRVAGAKKIARAIEEVLKQLGIEKARFTVRITQTPVDARASGAVLRDGKYYAATASGFDRVEFFISTNAGEEPKPLARVASGGEISRVMLALKTILARTSRLPMLVFDEIDTGISGRIASKVGMTMKSLGDLHQIVAITHLPQIAAMSRTHFVVEKNEQGGRTTTHVRRLDGEEHTREVAKLMSGEVITESSLQMARELIGL